MECSTEVMQMILCVIRHYGHSLPRLRDEREIMSSYLDPLRCLES